MSVLPRWFVESRLPGIGRSATEREAELFHNYLNLLSKWQKVQRLVGSAEPAWIVENVFLDSLCFLEAIPSPARTVADLGSGAGIPGVPIAIVRPDMEVTLIESRQRRASFLSTVVRELQLANVRVFASRAEDLALGGRREFDAVVIRCAGKARAVLDAARTLLKPGGVVVLSASPSGIPDSGGEKLVVRTPSGTLRTLHRYRDEPPVSR